MKRYNLGDILLTIGWVAVAGAFLVWLACCVMLFASGCGHVPDPVLEHAQVKAVVTEAQYEACNHMGLAIIQSARTCEEAVTKLQLLAKVDFSCAALFGDNAPTLTCGQKDAGSE